MTKALIDSSADTLAEVKTETVGNTSTNVKAEELLHTLADTVTEVKLRHYKTLNNMKAETLVDALSHTLTKDVCDNCRHTNLCGGQGTGQNRR